jgi:hypothetical protein
VTRAEFIFQACDRSDVAFSTSLFRTAAPTDLASGVRSDQSYGPRALPGQRLSHTKILR